MPLNRLLKIASLSFSILMPIIYGVMGFLMGAIGTALYNLIAGWNRRL